MNTEDDTLSTVIDTDTENDATGGGKAAIAEPSARDDVAAAFKEAEEQAEAPKKDEPKTDPKPDAKAEPKPEAKAEEKAPDKDDKQAADAEKTAEATETDKEARKDREPKPGEGEYMAPPKSFVVPEAREKWGNVPRSVRAEVHRVIEEASVATEQYKRYDDIRPFDELAKSNGRDLRESLVRLNQIENLIQANPIAGLNAILSEIGPRKQDGQPFSMMEVAQFIAQQGHQGYQQIVQSGQQAAQQQQGNQQIEALQNQIANMKAEAAAKDIIEPFRAANPRYAELEDDIAFFLQSGRIPASLSPSERLATAYDMAARIKPASHVDQSQADDGLAPDSRAASDLSGQPKSIKSSPGSVSDDTSDTATSDESVLDSIRAVQRRMRH
jgi:hypothetical protein